MALPNTPYAPQTAPLMSYLDDTFAAVGALGIIPCTASGTNVITLTPNADTPTVAAYANYQQFSFVAANTTTGSVTLQVGAMVALPVYLPGTSATQAGNGDITANVFYTVAYNSAVNSDNGGFIIVSAGAQAVSAVPLVAPQGRLSLTSGVSVMTSTVTAATTVYYVSHTGPYCPVYSGSSFTLLAIPGGNLAMGLDAVTPHVASGSVYDIFAVNNSGTLAIGVGPAWSSTTSRGTGAGTTQIDNSVGLWTNTNILTHLYGGASGTTDYGAVPANKGTYLGTIYATANGQTQANISPASAAGGGNAMGALYNAYNRVPLYISSSDSSGQWNYTTSTWRPADGNNNNRVTWLDGLSQTAINATYQTDGVLSAANAQQQIGIIIDATSGTPTITGMHTQPGGTTGTDREHVIVSLTNSPLLGLHFAQAMEWSNGTGAQSFLGPNTQAITVRTEY